MPIINTDLWLLSQGLCIFMKSQNLWDFAFEHKRKNKTKRFCYVRSWKYGQRTNSPAAIADGVRRTNHSPDVVRNLNKLTKTRNIMKKQIKYILLGLMMLELSHIQAQDSGLSKTDTNVVYGMHSGLALLMDVYVPTNPNGYGIIVIPGSGFHQLMSYDANPLNKNPWYLSNIIGTDNLINNGYTLFVINHRSAPVFKYPAAIEDAQRAVQFIRHNAGHYKISPDKIGAIGHSSGGHLVCMLGTNDDIADSNSKNAISKVSSRVQAVVSLAAPTDFIKFSSGTDGDLGAVSSFVGTHLPVWRGSNVPSEYEFELYAKASPISHVTKDDAPFLLVHGTNENVVPTNQSKIFHEKLLENKVNSKLIIIENGGHGLRVNGKVATDKYYDSVIEFFDMVIK